LLFCGIGKNIKILFYVSFFCSLNRLLIPHNPFSLFRQPFLFVIEIFFFFRVFFFLLKNILMILLVVLFCTFLDQFSILERALNFNFFLLIFFKVILDWNVLKLIKTLIELKEDRITISFEKHIIKIKENN